jgi:hypothetical protein
MPHAMRAPSVPLGLSQLADEFRRLDHERRRRGLSLGDASRYHGLFARLSEALAAGERKRRVDGRQFLRVPFAFDLMLTHNNARIVARCHDFGGGGCAVTMEPLGRGDELWLSGAQLGDERAGEPVERHELCGRTIVAWARPGDEATPGRVGLRFAFDVAAERDQVDRLFYRLLDRFLAR